MPEHLAPAFAPAPEDEHTSESEEMYLITVARAGEDGRSGPIPVADVAAELSVSVASANQMIRKLADRGLLSYEPYHGVELSDDGHRVADRVLRTRRLWARFLADHLGFSPADADDQACHLEHVTSEEAADRLAAYLGNPEAGPLGRPIPAGALKPEPRRRHRRLVDLAVGGTAEVVSVGGSDFALEFLAAEGVIPGAIVTVAGAGDSGWLIAVAGTLVHLSEDLARAVEVEPKDEV
jgi:DtxR family Mn-dependent transcriptional regulator